MVGLFCCDIFGDPEWNSLVSRIRLFRLVGKDFPNRQDLLQTGLYDRGSPLRHLVDVLWSFGWSLQPGLVMRDAAGRTFHLVLTPLFHVQHLLMVNWSELVSSKVRHRKGLEELEAVDCDFSRPSPSLQPQERGLLSQLVHGRHFTYDARAHFVGSTVTSVCPFCEDEDDSREHRVYQCKALSHVQEHFSDVLAKAPRTALLFGLWPVPSSLVAWQSWLEGVPWPSVRRTLFGRKDILFTDGSCLFPSRACIRLAAGAVVTPVAADEYETVWSGQVPTSCQSIPIGRNSFRYSGLCC